MRIRQQIIKSNWTKSYYEKTHTLVDPAFDDRKSHDRFKAIFLLHTIHLLLRHYFLDFFFPSLISIEILSIEILSIEIISIEILSIEIISIEIISIEYWVWLIIHNL